MDTTLVVTRTEERLFEQALQGRHYSATTSERGADYARRGRVLEVDFEWIEAPENIAVHATVKGSERTPYEVTIAISRKGSRLTVIDDCSCPVGIACKHSAAALFALQAQAGTASETDSDDSDDDFRRVTTRRAPTLGRAPEWSKWLARFDASSPLAVLSPLAPGLQLAVVLDADSDQPPNIQAQIVWVQPTKLGRLGKVEPLRDHELYDRLHGPLITAAWRQRIGLLKTFRQSYAGQSHALLGATGEAWLIECLQAGIPCFWQKPSHGQIELGDELPRLEWQWLATAEGQQRPAPRLPAGARLFGVERLWLLDLPAGRLSPLQSAADERALAQMLSTFPPVPPDEVPDLLRRWRSHPRLQSLPAPHEFTVVERTDIPPTPVLRMSMRKLHSSGYSARRREDRTIAVACLEFDYAGLRVDRAVATDTVSQLCDSQLIRVKRKRQSEMAVRQQLRAAGLESLGARHDLAWRVIDSDEHNDYLLRTPRKPVDAATLVDRLAPLRTQGFRFEFDPGFPRPIAVVRAQDWFVDIGESAAGADWFNVELGIDVDGQRISLLPILQRALADGQLSLQRSSHEAADAMWPVSLDDGRTVALPLQKLRGLVAPLLQWLDGGGDGVQVPRVAASVLDEWDSPEHAGLRVHTSKALREFADGLRNGAAKNTVKPPKALRAELRPYQRDGLAWLGFLARHRLGGVLADDMGLGKTMQVLAHLLAEKQARRLTAPALIVAPTSVVGNWREQAAKFAPSLRVRVLHGSDRHGHFEALDQCDIALTSYALLPRDREVLLEQPFSLVVFDEAQAIKNPRSQAAIVARELKSQRRLAVTGTPVENHLGELWSQIDCVLPGLLGDARTFNRVFRGPIEKHADADRQLRLRRRIAPFLLRRSKEQVAAELPPKTEVVRTLELVGRQRELYETLRLAMHKKVQQAIKQRGLAQSSIVILDALLKLRQACCDPRLVKLDGARGLAESAKLDALLSMLEELLSEGRRILLFSQFTGMLDLIEMALRDRKQDWVRLDGSTRDRDGVIGRFQRGECPLFLISLKAGGVGLNLTAADTVIHYDPWWNPAVERQATDRAHRIGQDKPVFVYKFICAGTVEEKIQALQQRKAELAEAVLDGSARQGLGFDEGDIAELFAPLG